MKKAISSVRRSGNTIRVVIDVFCFPQKFAHSWLQWLSPSAACQIPHDVSFEIGWTMINVFGHVVWSYSWAPSSQGAPGVMCCVLMHLVSLWKLRFINSAHRSLKKAPKRGSCTVRSSAIREGLDIQELIEFLYDHVGRRSVHHFWDISMAWVMGNVQSKAIDQGTWKTAGNYSRT